MDIDMMSIGKRIKDRRKELKLTQTDIKRECGISSGALSEIENGNRTPSIITFQLLSQTLNCSMDWLATGHSSDAENIFISECEDNLLKGFRELSEGDQDEIMEILNMKLRKAQRARRTSAKSSGLTDTGEANMVG